VPVGAIVVAGGRGDRMQASRPKQFLDVGGRTLVARSVALFDAHPRVDALVVVLPPDAVARGAELAGVTARPCVFAAGGVLRQDSVSNGLAAMPAGIDVVLVHDAARPFATAALIDRVLDGVAATGAAVPALPARDTIKRMDLATRRVAATIPREEIWLAQTPQGFRREILASALAGRAAGAAATDEAMLAERAGYQVAIVEGDETNVKITTPQDLDAARQRHDGAGVRAGTGYDLHRLSDGRPLMLAGVCIDRERGPVGHSDGDVVSHAVVDAMFGAAAAGDIGRHFPNTDPAWKDAPGLDLLGRARAILHDRGFAVTNVDVTVVLERPKLSPHIEEIATGLATALELPREAVSVKAKTNEGVDAVGRGEAIAAHAVALVARGRGTGR
jgi:2-C-methyl-D-erythritol 4-phosphate cytidylyltransferase/2-C-methyl-D-erythritol 2,4-cyclodiphosphate synthase